MWFYFPHPPLPHLQGAGSVYADCLAGTLFGRIPRFGRVSFVAGGRALVLYLIITCSLPADTLSEA